MTDRQDYRNVNDELEEMKARVQAFANWLGNEDERGGLYQMATDQTTYIRNKFDDFMRGVTSGN